MAAASAVENQRATFEELNAQAVRRCAVQAVVWGMPAANYDLMYQAGRTANADFNQIVYWSRLPDWKIQTLTPNPDAIYITPFFNTKDVGPMVLEIPPAGGGSITGSVMTLWQMPLEDVGPAGLDKGKGGRYLILPPGYTGPVPAGYLPLRSDTFEGYALLRSIPRSGGAADVAAAAAYGEQIKHYPLSRASAPPPTTFVDVVDLVYDSTIPYDIRFFESLDRIIQAEPWLRRDMAMIDVLKTIGIVKGKRFDPDPATREILNAAIEEAHTLLVARYERSFELAPYYQGSHWAVPASRELIEAQSTGFVDSNSYPTDDRGLAYSFAYFAPKHFGSGSFYLMTIAANDGQRLDGGSRYRLSVPAHVPVKQYWSATVYDRATHAPIRKVKWPSRSSNTPGLKKKPDGSVDIFFGLDAPSSGETNWIPTSRDGGFEVLFRFYGPEKGVTDKTWRLPDLERE